ncbi:hypothetical protein DFS34DRAFT_318792 [Phlyctochytrium arcticum]|nr:hypothetical protein DFS34DRAFT_318792 [Phlyctochytrium arcticum]
MNAMTLQPPAPTRAATFPDPLSVSRKRKASEGNGEMGLFKRLHGGNGNDWMMMSGNGGMGMGNSPATSTTRPIKGFGFGGASSEAHSSPLYRSVPLSVPYPNQSLPSTTIYPTALDPQVLQHHLLQLQQCAGPNQIPSNDVYDFAQVHERLLACSADGYSPQDRSPGEDMMMSIESPDNMDMNDFQNQYSQLQQHYLQQQIHQHQQPQQIYYPLSGGGAEPESGIYHHRRRVSSSTIMALSMPPTSPVCTPAALYSSHSQPTPALLTPITSPTRSPRMRSPSFSMGFKKDCEKCISGVRGHYMHVLSS